MRAIKGRQSRGGDSRTGRRGRYSFLLLVLSLAGVAICTGLWGPVLNAPLLISALGVVVGLLLILRKLLAPRRNWVIVDGSNVLYWEGDNPKLSSVEAVLADLKARRFDPIVWFDANAGYLVKGRYMGPRAFGRALGLPGPVSSSRQRVSPPIRLSSNRPRNWGRRWLRTTATATGQPSIRK
jgi:hypothetical protein